MNCYSNSVIYKISNNVDDNFYVGSTKNKLCKRKAIHHYFTKTRGKSKLYEHMRRIGFENCKIEVLEQYACEDKQALLNRERYWIEHLKPTLNTNRVQDQKVPNVERSRAYNRNYYHTTNRTKMLERLVCDVCNKQITKCNMIQHCRSKKHIENEQQKNNPNIEQ
jgi:group I intron endonuclease